MTSSRAPSSPLVTIGFLHTSDAHVPVFDALVTATGRAAARSHVDEALLARARDGASETELAAGVRTALTGLVKAGAQAVVCTCSTLGPLAESLAAEAGVPVLRVDRPMADRAVRTDPAEPGSPVRILVVVALASTLGPTSALLAESAAAAGRSTSVDVLRCDASWSLFESGRPLEFAAAVADAVTSWVTSAGSERPGAASTRPDVVVLAQASMAGAGDHLAALGVPVLTSPREAVRHAVDAVTAAHPTGGHGAVSG